jgi:hypothetical protein
MSVTAMVGRMLLAVTVAAAAMVGQASAAAIVSTAVGNGADTMLQNDSQDAGTGPDVVRGDIEFMKFRYLTDARVKIPYFRFDLSDVVGDRTGATLSLEAVFNNGGRVRDLDVWGLLDDNTDDAWPEAGTSYSNAPGFLYTDPDPGTAGNQPSNNYTIDFAKLTPLGTITTPAGTGVMTSSTANLNLDSFLGDDTNGLVTLVLLRSVSDGNVDYNFATKENVTPNVLFPTLTLPNATLVPEPTSAALCLLGLALGVGGARRRSN